MLIFRMFPDFASFNYSVTFDDVEYRLRFSYYPRSEGWYVDLLTPDGDAIIVGTRCVIGWPLWFGHVQLAIPGGLMMALDLEGDGLELTTQEELGERVTIVFIPPEEMKFESDTTDSPTIASVP